MQPRESSSFLGHPGIGKKLAGIVLLFALSTAAMVLQTTRSLHASGTAPRWSTSRDGSAC